MWTIRATSVTVRHDSINRFKKSRRLLLTFFAILIIMLAVAPNSTPFAQTSPAEDALIKRARAIHEKVINLDTHIDFAPADLTGERNYTQRLETQFNLPNMIDGGLDALFFSIYVGQTREPQNPHPFTSSPSAPPYNLPLT